MTMQSLCPNESQVTAVTTVSIEAFRHSGLIYIFTHENVSGTDTKMCLLVLKLKLKLKKKTSLSIFVIISRLAIRLGCKLCSHANTSVFWLK